MKAVRLSCEPAFYGVEKNRIRPNILWYTKVGTHMAPIVRKLLCEFT